MGEARPAWFVLPGQPLRCARGHIIRQEWELPEDGFPRCRHREKGGAECGRRVYALVLPRRSRGQHLTLVVDVTGQEIRALLERGADVDEILTALGLTWSQVGEGRLTRPTPPLATLEERR